MRSGRVPARSSHVLARRPTEIALRAVISIAMDAQSSVSVNATALHEWHTWLITRGCDETDVGRYCVSGMQSCMIVAISS